MDFSIFDWLQKQLGGGTPGIGVTGLIGNGGIPSGPIDPAAEVQEAVRAEPPREQTPGSVSAGVTGLLGGGVPTTLTEAPHGQVPNGQVPMPAMPPTQNVGMHPVQNPAESVTPMGAPQAPNNGITIRRVSSTPVDPNEKKLSTQLESLSKAGMKMAQAGQPQRSAGGGAAPQVHRGQAVSLLDLVFPNRKNMF